jgi:hypothetical protein
MDGRLWTGRDGAAMRNRAGSLALVGQMSAPTFRRSTVMAGRFKVGDHVSWNSEAGRVRGRIVKVHTGDVNYKGYIHHASKDAPQYAIKSDKTDHIALHKGTALRRIPARRPRPK